MKADKNNFRFRNDGSDEAKMAIWTISPHLDGSSLWYGIVNGIKDFWGSLYYEKYEHLPLVTPAEAIRLMQGDDLKDYYVAQAKWEPKWGDEVEGDTAAPFDLINKTGKYIGKHPNNEIEHLICCGNQVFRVINIRPLPPKVYDPRQPLFDHMSEEHGLTLLQDEMDEIISICNKINTPKPLEVTDEEVAKYWGHQHNSVIDTVRHFMELQLKGGKG